MEARRLPQQPAGGATRPSDEAPARSGEECAVTKTRRARRFGPNARGEGPRKKLPGTFWAQKRPATFGGSLLQASGSPADIGVALCSPGHGPRRLAGPSAPPPSKKPRLRNDPPTSAGHFSMRPDDQPASARHLAAPNLVPAIWLGLRLALIQENRVSEATRHGLRITLAGTTRWDRSCWLDLLPQLLRWSLVTGLGPARVSLTPRFAEASASQSLPSQVNRPASGASAVRTMVTGDSPKPPRGFFVCKAGEASASPNEPWDRTGEGPARRRGRGGRFGVRRGSHRLGPSCRSQPLEGFHGVLDQPSAGDLQ